MNFENWDWEIIIGFTAVLGFLWRQNRDMRSLSERVSKLEGMLSTFLSLYGKEKL